jgi:hypothetical protein
MCNVHHPSRPARQKTGSFVFGLCESATERLDESFLGIAYSTRRLVLVLVFDDRPVSEAEDKGNRKGVFVVNCRICPTTDVVVALVASCVALAWLYRYGGVVCRLSGGELSGSQPRGLWPRYWLVAWDTSNATRRSDIES